jgi:uncharacterized small protein (DUF1192 family)
MTRTHFLIQSMTRVILRSIMTLRLVGVKLTRHQLALLDAEVKRRRAQTAEVAASRSSVLRDALLRLVARDA